MWLPAFQGWTITPIQEEDIERVLDSNVAKKDLKPASRNNMLRQLSGFFSYALKRRWIKENPTQHIPLLKVRNHRTRWLRPHDVGAILRHCDPGYGIWCCSQ
ncbi:hypothetical protein ABI59_05215 [Acidobacteria bacterium Mor1]|nr:hypothetical protein ABI59_05215 [Acidobacteria bacterium Mor1]